MESNAYGDDYDADKPGMYWRRRFATMIAGLGLLGLLVWASSSGGGKPAGPAPLSSLSAAAYPGASASSAASHKASPQASAGAGLAPMGLPSATTDASASANSSANSKANSRSTRSASTTEPGGRCAPSAVVLSVFASSRSFPVGQDPVFGVDAVSTAPGTCTFDLSPAQLHLVVTSAGRVIWDSADCGGHGGADRLTRLARGVPVQETFTWNRTITLPGCVTLASSARPGSYAAQARTAGIDSELYTFKLSTRNG